MKHNLYDEEETSGSRLGGKLTYTKVVGVVSICLVLFGGIVVYSSVQQNKFSALLNLSLTNNNIEFTMGRVNYKPIPYFKQDTSMITTYKFLEGFNAVIEPSSDMELQFYNDEEFLTGFKYYFKICKNSDGSCQDGYKYALSEGNYVSGSVNFECTPYETFSIEVYQSNPATQKITGTVSGTGVCLYVRREIRDLTASDKEKFIEVSYKLSSTTEDEGRALYGENFHSDLMLLRFHHFNAGQQDADHIHEGNGFVTQHLKFTNMFELALQSVDKSVFLPYWDFTMDDTLHHTVSNSYIVDESLYGAMHFPKDIMKGFAYKDDRIEDGVIKNGRWAYHKAEMNTAFKDMVYGYGYMRAPWSMNPSPYISRFTSVFNQFILLPTCDMHRTILEKYDDMMDFFNAMAYEPHATIHTLAGGIYGCDMLLPLVDAGYINDESSAYGICKGWTFNLKEWYRHNYIAPRKNCVVNTTHLESSVCGFDCIEENKPQLLSFIFSSVSKYGNINKEGAADAWLNFICDGGDGGKIFPGDHLESASPADPSFWVIHPTLERLLQAKLMAGGFRTENWHTDPVKEFVCTKAKCYKAEYGRSDYFEDCCYGHYENDRLLDATTGKAGSYYGPTNAEVVKGTDPRSVNYNMPYIYDSFTWSHCTDQDFDGLLATLVKKAADPVESKSGGGSSGAGIAVGKKSSSSAASSSSSGIFSSKKAPN